jgi:hypothetical protein
LAAIVAAGIPVFYLSSRRATLRGESIARTAPL